MLAQEWSLLLLSSEDLVTGGERVRVAGLGQWWWVGKEVLVDQYSL